MMEMMTMTVEIEIPNDIQPFGWELSVTAVLDEIIGFSPEALALRSLWVQQILEDLWTE
jgi:predicted component of type VI protein secretion system